MRFRDLPLEKPELRELGRVLGEDRIRGIVRRFYDRMSRDILIGFFFDGKDLDRIASEQSAFLLRAMGLRPSYSGLAPADAHDDLPPILVGHFDRRLVVLDEHLKEEGLNDSQRQVWIAFENAFRNSLLNT